MNRANFQQTGGFPLETDTLNFMQTAYDIFNVLADVSGHLSILKGCVVTGNNVSDGVVAINGEVLFFKGGSIGNNVTIKENKGNRTFEDGSNKDVYLTRYATFSTASNSFLWANFKRLSTIQHLGTELPKKAENSSVEALNTRMTLLEKMITPVIGRGRIWWTGTLEQLERECPGWKEDTEWREKFPFHWNPNNPSYKDLTIGGGKEFVELEEKHLAAHSHGLNMRYGGYRHSDSGSKYTPIGEIGSWLQSERDGETNKSGQGAPHNNMPPYKLGMWIKYVG